MRRYGGFRKYSITFSQDDYEKCIENFKDKIGAHVGTKWLLITNRLSFIATKNTFTLTRTRQVETKQSVYEQTLIADVYIQCWKQYLNTLVVLLYRKISLFYRLFLYKYLSYNQMNSPNSSKKKKKEFDNNAFGIISNGVVILCGNERASRCQLKTWLKLRG